MCLNKKPADSYFDAVLKNCIQKNGFKGDCHTSDQCDSGLKCNVLALADQASNFFLYLQVN